MVRTDLQDQTALNLPHYYGRILDRSVLSHPLYSPTQIGSHAQSHLAEPIDTYLALVISQPIRVFFAIYRPCFLIVHIHNNFILYTNETIIHFGA